MKKLLTILVTLIFFTGCETLGLVTDKAAKMNDEALKSAEFTICNGASVGSVRRRFDTPELAELWRKMCQEQQGFKPNG